MSTSPRARAATSTSAGADDVGELHRGGRRGGGAERAAARDPEQGDRHELNREDDPYPAAEPVVTSTNYGRARKVMREPSEETTRR